MQEIKIKIYLNAADDDWSIEINGLRHNHVSSKIMEAFVETSMVMAERSLLEAASRRPQ
jgi:hypothetical protein